jgi:transketolase
LRRLLGALPLQANRPSAVICHTIKGFGTSETAQNLAWHHRGRTSDEDLDLLLRELEG